MFNKSFRFAHYFRIILLLVCMDAAGAGTEVFIWQDANGKTYYSDQPGADSRVMHIKPGDSYYFVKKVYDGDTVLLDNGQKVRLLGINTPEVESRNKDEEPGGIEAKHWLQNRLSGKKVRLVRDAGRKDKYGRILAHLFTQQDEHINLELVINGLATLNIHPPNLKYADELLAAQQQAEAKSFGLWGYPRYAAKPVTAIRQGQSKGWQRLTGHVRAIRESRKSWYLEFTDSFAARIQKQYLALFPEINFYEGKEIEIRGWVKRKKQRYTMLIRHPSAVKILNLDP